MPDTAYISEDEAMGATPTPTPSPTPEISPTPLPQVSPAPVAPAPAVSSQAVTPTPPTPAATPQYVPEDEAMGLTRPSAQSTTGYVPEDEAMGTTTPAPTPSITPQTDEAVSELGHGFYQTDLTMGPYRVPWFHPLDPAAKAAKKVAESQLPKTRGEAATMLGEFATPLVSTSRELYQQATALPGNVKDWVQGRKSFRDFALDLDPQGGALSRKLMAAEQTPANSEERWETGLELLLQVLMAAGAAKGFEHATRAPQPGTQGAPVPERVPMFQKPTTGGVTDAQLNRQTTQVHGDVLYPGGTSQGAGQVSTAAGGTGVQARGQGTSVQGPAQPTTEQTQVVAPLASKEVPGAPAAGAPGGVTPREEVSSPESVREEVDQIPTTEVISQAKAVPGGEQRIKKQVSDWQAQRTVGRPSTPEEIAYKTEMAAREIVTEQRMKQQQEAPMSVGAASREEYMRRYSLVGASKLLQGHVELGRFSMEMRKEFGTGIDEHLPEIYQRANELIQNRPELFRAAGMAPTSTDVTRAVDKLIGVTKARETPVLVKPYVAQKAAYKAAEKAGAAGYRRGVKETKAAAAEELKATKQAMREDASTRLRQSRQEAREAMSQLRKDVAQADRFSRGDWEQTRKNLVNYINDNIPPEARGQFLNRVTKALRPAPVGRLPSYKPLYDLLDAIDAKADQIYRSNLIDDIKTVAQRAADSPSVDLDAKRIMTRLLKDLNLKNLTDAKRAELEQTRDYLNRMQGQGKDVIMPKRVVELIDSLWKTPIDEVSTSVLEDLHNKLRASEKLGRIRFKNRMQRFQAEQLAALQDILKGPGRKLEARPEFIPQPGERTTVKQKFLNKLRSIANSSESAYLGHMSEDVIFDIIQDSNATYMGPIFDHIRFPLDAAYDRAESRFKDYMEPLAEIIRKNKLGPIEEGRIGLWATLMQDGGEARALASGVTPETIQKLRDNPLTPGEQEAYNYARQTLDESFPLVQDTMHELYNIQVLPERNYAPWMPRWSEYISPDNTPIVNTRTGEVIPIEDLHNFTSIAGNFYGRGSAKLPQGFTYTRLDGAERPIRFDFFNTFEKHMHQVSRLVEMQGDLEKAGKIIRSPQFGEKFGQLSQQLMNEWLRDVSTDGAGINAQRGKFLPTFRRMLNRSSVFYNLTSNIKHASAIPQGMIMAGGPHLYISGLLDQFKGSTQRFLERFPQVIDRQGGDMSMQELQDHIDKTPLMQMVDKTGFWVGKELDAVNSRAVFIARYKRNAIDMGLSPDLADYDPANPAMQKAAYNAMTFMRRTVSSTLPKDLQPVLARGRGFRGHTDLARLMNAFRQFALERFSIMTHDMPQAFKSGNYLRGTALASALVIASIYETQIPRAVRKGMDRIFPGTREPKHEESWGMAALRDTLTMIPYVNNLFAALLWGESGVPIADAVVQGLHRGSQWITAKRPSTRRKAGVQTMFDVARITGVPGAGQAERIVVPWAFPPKSADETNPFKGEKQEKAPNPFKDEEE